MKTRPLLLRYLPRNFRESVYYRYYHCHHNDWLELFNAAPLELAPNMSMFDLPIGDVISGNIAFNGFYELGLSREMVKLARAGGLLVDVGANMGYFSLIWCANNPQSRVIAYEASPRNIKYISSNIEKNRLSDRIALFESAASHKAGCIAFSLEPEDQTGWGGIAVSSDERTVSVNAVRLDEDLGLIPVDALKIDVEGADTFVLYGCENLLRNKLIKTIFFEQNKTRMAELGIRAEDARDFLQAHNYSCQPMGESGDEWVARPI